MINDLSKWIDFKTITIFTEHSKKEFSNEIRGNQKKKILKVPIPWNGSEEFMKLNKSLLSETEKKETNHIVVFEKIWSYLREYKKEILKLMEKEKVKVFFVDQDLDSNGRISKETRKKLNRFYLPYELEGYKCYNWKERDKDNFNEWFYFIEENTNKIIRAY